MLKNSHSKKLVSYCVEEQPPKINLDMDMVETQSEVGSDDIKDLSLSSGLMDELRHDIESLTSVLQLVSFKPLLCKTLSAKTASKKL